MGERPNQKHRYRNIQYPIWHLYHGFVERNSIETVHCTTHAMDIFVQEIHIKTIEQWTFTNGFQFNLYTHQITE